MSVQVKAGRVTNLEEYATIPIAFGAIDRWLTWGFPNDIQLLWYKDVTGRLR